MGDTASNVPAKKFRIGNINAAIWENYGANRKAFQLVRLSRSYKDGEQWKKTDQLNHGDLLNAAIRLQQAHEWISAQA